MLLVWQFRLFHFYLIGSLGLFFSLFLEGKTFETIDPRTGEVQAYVAEGDKDDVDLAVKAARAAFDHGPWPRLTGSVSHFILNININIHMII